MLGEINSIISASGANIEGQYLGTDENVGYLIVDVQADQVEGLASEIKQLERCLLTRVCK